MPPSGSAAGIRRLALVPRIGAVITAVLTGAPAGALDLEKAAQTSEPCPGKPGFVRLPGARSCTRLSGRVVARGDIASGPAGTVAGPGVTGRLAIDNRTETDLGEVRTFVRIGNGRR